MKKHNTKEQKIMQNADNEDTCMCVYHAGKREGFNLAIKRVQEEIKEDIKIWETDNKGKERYYGTTGCVVKVLEELKFRLNKLQQEKTK